MAYDTSQTSFHPTLASLQDQLRKLLPGRPAATAATAAALTPQAPPRPGLVQMAMDNAPLLLEAFGFLMDKMRRHAPELPAPAPLPVRRRRRTGLLRPVLIVVAVAGAGYLVSRMARPGTGQDVPPGR